MNDVKSLHTSRVCTTKNKNFHAYCVKEQSSQYVCFLMYYFYFEESFSSPPVQLNFHASRNRIYFVLRPITTR